ncbi:MAG: hypothetical protein DI537_41085 [Stutzerimonas stutzeri]|nr:MAG: hypothetical protein DI537_41085 [Stutzerimonas stutzeri]
MRYTIYRVTNTLNGKYYIGKHQTLNPNDRYFGSGKALREAIKLHGKSMFVKEILFDFDSEAEMNAMEIELVNEALVADRNTYNLTVGGEGGGHFKGRTHSAETRERLAEHQRGKSHTPETLGKLRGRTLSPEHRAKIAAKARERKLSAESRAKIA